MTRFAYGVTIAASELKSGIKGFGLFLICLAIGVAAIAASGSMAQAFRAGLDAEQRRILGGDFVLSLRQRAPSPQQLAFFNTRGRTSLATDDNTMGQAGGQTGGQTGTVRRLIQVRAVDSLHPLEGTVTLQPAGPLQPLLAQQNGLWGGVAEQALLDAFSLKVGDVIDLPYGQVQIRAVLLKEPDALGRGVCVFPPSDDFQRRAQTSLDSPRRIAVFH
ncbi:MAG: hypothetical protein HC777_03920 [Hyphomonadaceae bacterium]|nr:hypothetical protein [Hyphomonadaceae bacterium]